MLSGSSLMHFRQYCGLSYPWLVSDRLLPGSLFFCCTVPIYTVLSVVMDHSHFDHSDRGPLPVVYMSASLPEAEPLQNKTCGDS